jgi:membrane protease YdiL (CAAX protease family)
MIGILFGYIYVYTGKICNTIALHMIFNLVGGVYATEMLKRIDLERLTTDPVAEVTQHMTGFLMMMGYFAFILAAFMGAIVAVIVFFFKKPPRLLLQKSERPLTAAEWARVGLLNPGVWILAAVILLLFL